MPGLDMERYGHLQSTLLSPLSIKYQVSSID